MSVLNFAIITPTVGRPVLENALASVKAQTYKKYAHIVIGDGQMPPDVGELCGKYGAMFRSIERAGNFGAGARTAAMRQVGGGAMKYILFLDDDNILLPDCLARYAAYAESHNEPPLMYQDVIFHNQYNEGWLQLPRQSKPPQKADWDSLNGCFRWDTIEGMEWAKEYDHDYLLAVDAVNRAGEAFQKVDGFSGVHF
jgi:glycosyltransferase involved in cell wall biosynthesis